MKDHVQRNQEIVDKWKNVFDVLFYWNIKFINDGEHYCFSQYNLSQKTAIIYMCDILDEEEYIIHEIVKIALIASTTQELKFSFIDDICSLIIKSAI